MKLFTCFIALFTAIFILGCSENNETTAPQTSINQEAELHYLYVSPLADDYEVNNMPFAGECTVYKSTDQANWSALVPFSWEANSSNYGKYALDPNTYYKWQGSNLGEPNDWETTTRWYGYHQVGNPNDDVRDRLCTFYKD